MNDEVVVDFKSIPENYEKEEDGRKPNTLREVERSDHRFAALDCKTATHVRIHNTITHKSFKRKITDITYWCHQFIISWDATDQARASAIKEGLQNHNESHELGFNRHPDCHFCNLEETVREEIEEPIRADERERLLPLVKRAALWYIQPSSKEEAVRDIERVFKPKKRED